MTSTPSPKLRCLAFAITALLVGAAASAETISEWTGGTGDWNDPARWRGALPAQTGQVIINGTEQSPSDVTLDQSDVLIDHIAVSQASNSRASFRVNGPALTVIGTVDIGKYDGSNGRFILNSGNVFAGTFFFSGGGGPDQEGRGVLEIHGGSIVTKDIEIGDSSGSTCTLRVVGSKASAFDVEDGLRIGVYNYIRQEKVPRPSTVELIFDLDAQGVTPIFTWGPVEGRANFPVPNENGDGLGTCRLQINLLAPPPSGDILLIGAANPCIGTFTGLPEGATVHATFAGKTYEWTLTYQGDVNKCAIMLTNPRVRAADGTTTPYVAGGPVKSFRFDHSIVESAYRQLYRQADAKQTPVGGKVLAFPGAQGYGAYTVGGRGGKILFVTNLNDSGPGSLREALETKGPRTIIFRVGGIIETKGLSIREPYVTVAGQTAPGDGICLKKAEGRTDTVLEVNGTHDVILRFLRVRAGNNTGDFRGDNLRVMNTDNFIIDHCSCSWGNPETLSASGTVDRFTVQWCIASEGNDQQRHAFSTIIGGNRSTWHHNLFAHMESRVPRWGDITVQCDFRNNVLYDWGSYCGYGDLRTLNYVNNYLRNGPSTTQRYIINDPKIALPASLYISGNVVPAFPVVFKNNWLIVHADKSLQSPTPFPAPPILMQTAEEAFASVLKNAGAILPRRDSVDARAVSDAKSGTGKIINSEKDVGGWPAYTSGTPPVDTANDGIPDDWKKTHGLPMGDLAIANKITDSGYTELELYLNSLVPDDVMK